VGGLERGGQRLLDPSCYLGGTGSGAEVGAEDGELVATEPRDRVGEPEQATQPVGGQVQDFVACPVPGRGS
jgi:hypothetical protein